MFQTETNISQALPVVATIDPDAYTAAAYETGVVDMSLFERVMFIVQVGTLGASATVDFTVDSDPASGGSYATEERAITQLTKAGSDDDKQVVVEVRGYDVAANGNQFIRGQLTVGTATCDASVVAIGIPRGFVPATDIDLATVAEIVAPAS